MWAPSVEAAVLAAAAPTASADVAPTATKASIAATPPLRKRVLSGLPARKPSKKASASKTNAPSRPRTLKERAAASLTSRPRKRVHVEAIVADVQSTDEFSSMPPTQSSKPQGRLQRLWSKVVSAGKKVITSPTRWFKRK
ncbi:MAG: hypothetical protein V3U65_14560 [Granulosicoccaceae bacterium]